MTVEQLTDIVGGTLLRGSADMAAVVVDDVVIDSRRVRSGSLFVALTGEHTDGHAFLGEATARGAAACLVAEDRAQAVGEGVTAVVVDDPADALLGLARWVRDTVDPTVVGVTGSSGKTTTKDLIGAAVAGGRRAVVTRGSFNNELGLPLTCCDLGLGDDLLVAEVGARGIGHIATLAAVLRPDVAVVTTISGAHLETFGSIEMVAQAKGELVDALGPGGSAVLNADDPRVAALAARSAGRVVTYGLSPRADVRAMNVSLDGLARPTFTVGEVRVRLALPGLHNVGNALAALAVAEVVGVDRAEAAARLETAEVSRWRMELVRTRAGVTVLNDAYNANPASTAAALRTLAALHVEGQRWAALGPMAELGPVGEHEHIRIGRLAADLGIDGLVTVGPAARPIADGARAGQSGSERGEGPANRSASERGEGPANRSVMEVIPAAGVDDALEILGARLWPGAAVLVKASRSAGLERLAGRLVEELGGGKAPGSDAGHGSGSGEGVAP